MNNVPYIPLLLFFLSSSFGLMQIGFSSRINEKLKYIFPLVGFIILTILLIDFIFTVDFSKLDFTINIDAKKISIPWIFCLLSNIFFIAISWKILFRKLIYKTKQLAKKIIVFTEKAHPSILKLLCGDLDFLGDSPKEMNENQQFNQLKDNKFKKIEILCKSPTDQLTKIRYGKIIDDISNLEIRFYRDQSTDLEIRGRIAKNSNGIDKMLIYNRIKKQTYKSIETDLNSSTCQLHLKIWDHLWEEATPQKPQQINFLELYRETKS